MIRRLTTRDAPELARLLARNRAFLAPFEPDWPDDYLTVDAQRARIRKSHHLYGIVDEGTLAGTITLSNLVRGVFESATVGYWVEGARNGRGLATRAVASIVELAFMELGLHRLEAGILVDNVASQRVLEKNRFTRIGWRRVTCASQDPGATTSCCSERWKTESSASRTRRRRARAAAAPRPSGLARSRRRRSRRAS